jgi:hypothetical protein
MTQDDPITPVDIYEECIVHSPKFSFYVRKILPVETPEMRDKRSKFVELANKRVNRAIKDLRLIGNLSNRAAYEFGDEDTRKIVKTLQKEVETLRQRFSGNSEEADKAFSL